MPPLQRYVIALTGGLQDSRPIPDPSDLVTLYNFSLFRGRFALRAPVEQIQTIGSESHILHITTHLSDIWILTWNSTNNDVDLYQMGFEDPGSGWPAESFKTQVYTGVTSKPDIFMTSFSGGTADAPQDRLYIFDYNQVLQTKYWVESTTTLVPVTEDFDADDTAEDAHFSLMAPFQFHLWGTGFYSEYGAGGDALRPEMLRFSQPGLIPNVDPAGGTPSSKEWFTLNHRSVGRRGDKIKAVSYAAGNMMVFQAGSTHSIFGYGQDSWATKQLSDHIGAVGPRAATATDTGGLCFFWSHDGPFMTDGSEVKGIGEDIRQHVIDHQADEKVSAAYSPDDGIVYFTLYPEGVDVGTDPDPEYYLGYDTIRQKWCDGSWLNASGAIPVSCMVTATSRDIAEAPGPSGDPTGLTVYNQLQQTLVGPNADLIYLSWSSAELTVDSRTYIYRDVTPAFTPGSGNEIGYVSGLETRYTDGTGTQLSRRTTYYYQVKHWRNGTYSSASNEVNARTWCEPPLYVSCESIPTGIRWHVHVPTTATPHADIEMQRTKAANLSGSPGTWFQATIRQDIAAGVEDSWDDTVDITTSPATLYYCVARIKDVNNAGETPSDWWWSGYPGRPHLGVYAGTGSAGTLAITQTTPVPHSLSIGDGFSKVIANINYTGATAGADFIRVFFNDGGGYPADYTSYPCRSGSGFTSARHVWTCPHSGGNVRIKFEAWAGDVNLVDTAETALIDPCGTMEY